MKWLLEILWETGGRIVVGVAFVAQVVLFCLIWRSVWPATPQSGYAVAVVLAVIATLLEIKLLLRLLRRPSYVDRDMRAGKIGSAGIGLALLLAIGMLAKDVNNQSANDQFRATEERDREAYRQRLSDPRVRRGMEAMQRMNQRPGDTRAASRPVQGDSSTTQPE
jgi:hypothetical protein